MRDLEKKREYDRQYYAAHKAELLLKAGQRAAKRWREHSEVILAYQKKRRDDGTSKCPEYARASRQRQKVLVLEHYGASCACCGEIVLEFLGVDHVLGNGDRVGFAKPSQGGGSSWREAINSGFSSDFRILCHNCNNSTFFGRGVCAHHRDTTTLCKVAYPANQKSRAKLKQEVIQTYGGCCVCCGESKPDFLTMDHVNGDGGQCRRTSTRSSWLAAKQAGFPPNFRILCFNCNFSAGRHDGMCCHQFVDGQALPTIVQ